MRDYNKLRAFQLADDLAMYRHNATFPDAERFGLTTQLRRAAVSAPSHIIEGCARSTLSDYLRFLDISYGSSCEVQFQLSQSRRLGFANDADFRRTHDLAVETSKVIGGLIRPLRNEPKA